MPSLYLYVLDTLADWETGHVTAELVSGRYLKKPAPGYNLVLCGRTLEPVTTMGGICLTPEVLVTDIRPETGDLLLFPGADTWLDPSQAPVMEKVRELLAHGAHVAAICGATMALANAGLLDERRHTSNDLAVLKMFCPGYKGEKFYVNEPAVTDGNLVTASGLAPVEFAYQVFGNLDVMTPAAREAWHGLNVTRRPEFFYALMGAVQARDPAP
jgi:putative intracellular protease/amidase